MSMIGAAYTFLESCEARALPSIYNLLKSATWHNFQSAERYDMLLIRDHWWVEIGADVSVCWCQQCLIMSSLLRITYGKLLTADT